MSLPATRPAKWKDLTDTQRAYWLVNNAGPEGLHSWDAESLIPSKNAPQRIKDVVSKGFPIFKASERRNGRPGVRWWVARYAPDFAVPVKANHEQDFGSAAASEDGADSGAVPQRPRLTLVWDWTGPELDERWERRAA